MKKTLDPAMEMSYFLLDAIENCKKLSKRYEKNELDRKYEEYCEEISRQLIEIFLNVQDKQFDSSYKGYNFFLLYIHSWFNYIIDTKELKNKKIDMALHNLLISALKKYKDIIFLMENKQYESSIILFRSLYENIVILCFLNYNDCFEEIYEHSFYKLFKKAPVDSEDYNDIHEKLKCLEQKYTKADLKSNYGWARKIISKNNCKIYFTDILEKVIINNDFLKNMYEDMSLLVHSNSTILNDAHFVPLLENNLIKYINCFGIPFLTKCFYDVFCDISYGNANFFLKICEISMKKYGIEINIR